MSALITTLIIIASILLILVVLIQNPKGGGIASNFSAGNNIMGVKRTTDLVEKWTWGLAVGIMVLAIASGMFYTGGNAEDGPKSKIGEEVENASPVQTPVQTVPNQDQGGQVAPANPDAQ